ncbi:MAG: hypothetical protein R3E09_06455 [Novosphingobium sp.]
MTREISDKPLGDVGTKLLHEDDRGQYRGPWLWHTASRPSYWCWLAWAGRRHRTHSVVCDARQARNSEY